MRENTDQNNSKYGHFSHTQCIFYALLLKIIQEKEMKTNFQNVNMRFLKRDLLPMEFMLQ